MKGFFGEMKSKKEVKSRQGSLIFFLMSERWSIYQVKNGKSSLKIFWLCIKKVTIFQGIEEIFDREHFNPFIIFILLLNNFFVWDARMERDGDWREMLKAGMRNFELSEPE